MRYVFAVVPVLLALLIVGWVFSTLFALLSQVGGAL